MEGKFYVGPFTKFTKHPLHSSPPLSDHFIRESIQHHIIMKSQKFLLYIVMQMKGIF